MATRQFNSVCRTPLVARMVGNRLWFAADVYDERGEEHVAKETRELAQRFHAEADRLSNGQVSRVVQER